MDIIRSLLILSCMLLYNAEAGHQIKRQIYREQVLPFRGGKVPEAALRADRLALNRLNKEGIAVPDGVLLEHRHVYTHPHTVRHDPEDESSILRVVQQPDNRYVPHEGRYHSDHHATVASTYLIRRPIEPSQTNIRTPEQQRPLHQFLNHNQHTSQPNRHHYEALPLPQHRAPPVSKHSYPSAPTHYSQYQQHVKDPPLIYHAVPVPFQLPNKEVFEEDYFTKSSYPVTKSPPSYVHEEPTKVEWPFANTGGFEKFSLDFNSLQPTNEFDFQPSNTHFRFYESPQLQSFSHNHFLDFFEEGWRFSRKTEESHAEGVTEAVPTANSGSYGERIRKRQKVAPK